MYYYWRDSSTAAEMFEIAIIESSRRSSQKYKCIIISNLISLGIYLVCSLVFLVGGGLNPCE